MKESLLAPENITFMQDIICKRDENNNGLSRKETIEIISGLESAKKFKQAESRLD